jgi:rhamnosyltransferase
MLNKPKVFVLLGTYNGEKYVLEQVDSILQQSYPNFVLLIRDDGSCDLTRKFVRTFATKDKRVVIIENKNETLGASANFGLIAEHSVRMGAQYVCFSDQDDIWEPWKIERQLDLMLKTESSLNASTPILLHSDLAVVNDRLGIIHPSYMRFQKTQHENFNPIRVLLVQNFVTGCTMMANQSLLKLSLPIPQCAVMHDWWMALCASTWGKIEFLSAPTVYYRQHWNNEIGAKGFWNLINPVKTSVKNRFI